MRSCFSGELIYTVLLRVRFSGLDMLTRCAVSMHMRYLSQECVFLPRLL